MLTSVNSPRSKLKPLLPAMVLFQAPYGFAGYGYIDINENQVIVIEGGELEATGTVILFDDTRDLPDSIALYYYVYRDLDESSTNFDRGQGEVDPSTGAYAATIPVPDGKSRIILSFVVMDEADTLTGSTNINQETVFALEVLSNDCEESYLTFTLEWDSDANLDLSVFEPNGSEVVGGYHGVSKSCGAERKVSRAQHENGLHPPPSPYSPFSIPPTTAAYHIS